RSSQGYTFSLGSGSVSWRSTRSSSVLSSSCEAEIYATAMAAQELRWLTYLLTDLGERPSSPPVLYVDNKAAIALCQEHKQEHRTKHIALRYFLARELQQRGQLCLRYVATRANAADIFTKALQPACFAFLNWSYDPLLSPTLPMGGIHLEGDSATQEIKLYHGKGGLYIGKAVLKNNVFVLDFVPDLGTVDSDGIVTFTSWTHPPDLDPDFSPEGFWYSHTIPEAERTRASATIQHSAAAEPTPAAEETTSAAAETTSAAAEKTAAAAATSTPIVGPSTASAPINDTPLTPAQQLNPAPREAHQRANFTASFYSNSDLYRRSPGHRAGEDIWHARMGHPSNTVLNNTIRAGVLDKDSLLLTDGSELRRARGTYTITFIDAATRYVWHLNLPSKDMAFEAFVAWLPYRPPTARADRFSQRAQWGLNLGIERNYNAWKIFDVHSKATVAARDVIFYERLTLPTYHANLEEDRDPTGGFRGDRRFASAADEADWDEQNVDEASEEAGPLPYCSVNVPMDDENPRESANAEVFYHFTDNDYVTPTQVNTNEAERTGPNFIPDPEAGDEAAYSTDTTLPRYTQSGLQILGLVTAVHGTEIPKVLES
ncbi:unnamed protein product, partial [Closterium sp. NIES-53]